MRLEIGDIMPRFRYDTPYEPQKDFYRLLQGETPLTLVFLANFGHPVTRFFLAKYYATYGQLEGSRLAVVVRSRPEAISSAFPPGAMPFEMICDPEGVLYDYFEIPAEISPRKYASIESVRILRRAEKDGYKLDKDQPQQLPLTLVLADNGGIGLCHYGTSLTDFPEDCTAISRTVAHMDENWRELWEEVEPVVEEPVVEEPAQPAPAVIPEDAQPAPVEKVQESLMDEPTGDIPDAWTGALPELKDQIDQAVEAADADAEWMDHTAELLLDFKSFPPAAVGSQEPVRKNLYDTTGEIDIYAPVKKTLFELMNEMDRGDLTKIEL